MPRHASTSFRCSFDANEDEVRCRLTGKFVVCDISPALIARNKLAPRICAWDGFRRGIVCEGDRVLRTKDGILSGILCGPGWICIFIKALGGLRIC